MSTIWESTCGDGAKRQLTSAQMGEGSLALLLWALTQTGEAAVDKQRQATGLCSSKHRRVKKGLSLKPRAVPVLSIFLCFCKLLSIVGDVNVR